MSVFILTQYGSDLPRSGSQNRKNMAIFDADKKSAQTQLRQDSLFKSLQKAIKE